MLFVVCYLLSLLYYMLPQHNATHCNTLQHTATHCKTLQHTATHCNKERMDLPRRVGVYYM